LLVPKRVILNIPLFLREKDQLSLKEEAETRHIASTKKMHVKRAIERYVILQGVITFVLA